MGTKHHDDITLVCYDRAMIRFIVAIDEKRGLANNHGIPWQGKVPTDVAYFREKTTNSSVMMGYGWYTEQKLPLVNRRNLVATSSDEELRPGFEKITDARKFLSETQDDVWVGGGAGLFASTIDLADELYITRLEGDFKCTKFFPEFDKNFTLKSRSDTHTESDINFCFEVWERKGEKA